jgi:hypothetical protein
MPTASPLLLLLVVPGVCCCKHSSGRVTGSIWAVREGGGATRCRATKWEADPLRASSTTLELGAQAALRR